MLLRGYSSFVQGCGTAGNCQDKITNAIHFMRTISDQNDDTSRIEVMELAQTLGCKDDQEDHTASRIAS